VARCTLGQRNDSLSLAFPLSLSLAFALSRCVGVGRRCRINARNVAVSVGIVVPELASRKEQVANMFPALTICAFGANLGGRLRFIEWHRGKLLTRERSRNYVITMPIFFICVTYERGSQIVGRPVLSSVFLVSSFSRNFRRYAPTRERRTRRI